MTTTPTAPVQTTTSNRDKAVEMAKRFAFPLFVLVAGIITILTLSATGLSAGEGVKFTYPASMAVIVGVYNLVIMAWPAYKSIVKKQFLLRPVIIASTIIITFLVLPFVVRVAATVVGTPEAWIPFVLGVVAVGLHGYGAVLLARFVEPDPEIVKLQEATEGQAKNIAKATTKLNAAIAEHTARKAADSDIEAAHKALEKEARLRSEALTTASEAYQKSSPVGELGEVKVELEAATTAYAKLREEAATLKAAIKREDDDLELADLNRELLEKNSERKKLRDALPDLRTRLEQLEVIVAASPLKATLDAAEKASAEASLKEAEKREELTEAAKKKKAAAAEVGVKGAKRDKLIKEKTDADARIADAHKAAKDGWRDGVFWPVLVLTSAMVLYSGWYIHMSLVVK